ncbi:hypothetical protein H0X09_01640 [Candidatus Saccharibacteria bacterium]|nr:hypothetical protein [Candidatus Saccharibacteria bacterium]
MKKIDNRSRQWKVSTVDPPMLTRQEWVMANLLGGLFILTALLQLISFGEFADILKPMGLPGPGVWAAAAIGAELLAAASLFRLKLSYLFRLVAGASALLVSGFWFVLSAQNLATGREQLPSSGLFGGFFNQSPGWWVIVEVTVLMFSTIYVVALTRYIIVTPLKRK